MKLQDFLIPFLLAVVTTWLIFRFFIAPPTPSNDTQSGQSFKAPTVIEINLPLKTVVPLGEVPAQVTHTTVETTYGKFVFSSDGAALTDYIFKRMISGDVQEIPIIEQNEARPGAFLMAFESDILRAYELRRNVKEDNKTVLEYEGHSKEAFVTKKFTIFHDVPRIDLTMSIDPQGGNKVQPRIFLPAPFIKQVDYNLNSGIVYSPREEITKTKSSLLANQFWAIPTLFGAEDRYFVNASVRDDGFTQRGYYMGEKSPETLTTIFEGPFLQDAKKTWTLSFYCGPKDVAFMVQVDPRLEGTLDYGWLSPLVKIMLVLLKFLYKFLKNYGWAIIVLTFLLRLIQVPFTIKNQKMAEHQKEFQQKMRYIEQKYQNDPQALHAERLVLTKKYGASSLKSTLPQLLQIPFLFALNRALSSSFELYHAPFMGWITDLSARDPYYILPLLSGAGILVQSMTSTDMRGGISMFLFAAILVAITAHLAAGLTLYLCVSTWLGIALIYLQKRFKFS